jgi:hypothetical protein
MYHQFSGGKQSMFAFRQGSQESHPLETAQHFPVHGMMRITKVTEENIKDVMHFEKFNQSHEKKICKEME